MSSGTAPATARRVLQKVVFPADRDTDVLPLYVDPNRAELDLNTIGMTAKQRGRIPPFRIKDGVEFHNGKTVTADDIIWSYTRIIDPKAPKTGSANLAQLKPSATTSGSCRWLTARLFPSQNWMVRSRPLRWPKC